MIKNIILDVGGVIFDDSKTNVERLLGKNVDHIYKVAYGSGFKKCLLGEMSIKEYIDSLKDEDEFDDIKYILEKDNLEKSYPLMKDNFEYVKELKKQGFRLFLLTNITKESHEYIDSVINIDKIFDGGIYSYQEHLVKPNYEIYELIINKYNLNKDETLFFDDKVKNVNAANECGIRSYVFTSIDDIKSKIM